MRYFFSARIQITSSPNVIDTWSVNITSHNNADWLDIRYRLVTRDTLSGYTFRLDDNIMCNSSTCLCDRYNNINKDSPALSIVETHKHVEVTHQSIF